MKRIRLHLLAAALILVSHAAFAKGNLILPPPEQLVTMSIQQRLDLMQQMNALPPKTRDANLNALKQEINSLSPRQKQDMADHFQSEYAALPRDEQDKLRSSLAQAHQEEGASSGQ